MPCVCGAVTCICFYFCDCQSHSCACRACMVLRFSGRSKQVVSGSPNKQNYDQNKPQPSKKSAPRDSLNEQMSSLMNDPTPGHSQIRSSQMENSATSVHDQGKQSHGSTPATKSPKQSSNNDPYPIIRKHLSRPLRPLNYDPTPILRKRLTENTPPSNYDHHATLKRQLSQPAPPSNNDPHATLKRQLSEPCKIPISENSLSELSASVSHHDLSSTDGSSLLLVSNNNPYLPSTSRTGSSTAPSASSLNKDLKSGKSTNSRSKKVPTTSSDSNNSYANIEFIKEASDKALPTYESFSSCFTAPSSDENNHNNFGLANSTSQNPNTRHTSTNPSDRCNDPLYLETSDVSAASACNNSESRSFHSPDRIPLQIAPQEHPLNLCLSNEDKSEISPLELPARSPSPVPTEQRMDTMESSNIPSEGDNQRAEPFNQGYFVGYYTGYDISYLTDEILDNDSTAQESYPETRSESTQSTSGSSEYDAFQNASQYKYTTHYRIRYESHLETISSNYNQNLTSPLSAPSTSGYFPPHPTSQHSQAPTSNPIPHCNDQNDTVDSTAWLIPSDLEDLLEKVTYPQYASEDLNQFPETPENPHSEHQEFSTSSEQTSSTERQSVIMYQPSQVPSQSTSSFSASQTVNPVNTPYGAQSHQASSTSPPSLNQSDDRLLASQTSNVIQLTPQASASIQPIYSDVNTSPVSESMETYDISQEHQAHHSQSSSFQRASSGTSPSRRTAHYRNDETGENS